MNIKYKPLIIVLVAILLLSSSVYVFRDSLATSPFNSKFDFSTISRVDSDKNNNLYVISDTQRIISKIDPSGLCLYQIKIEDSSAESVSLFTDMAVDPQGRLYVLQTDLDQQAIYVVGESILRYTAKGKLDKVLFQIPYKAAERPLRTGRIKNLQIKNDNFSFVYVSGNQLWLKNLPSGQDQVSSQLIATLPPETYLSELVGTLPDELFYSTQRGEIYWLAQNAAPVLIYPPESSDSPALCFPAALNLGSDHNLYFVDRIKNQVTGLIFGERTIQRKMLFPLGELANQNIKDLNDICLAPGGRIVIAASNRLLTLEPTGKLGKVLTGANYTGSHIAFNVFIWLLLLAVIGLFIYVIRFIYIELLDRRISITIKQTAIATPIIILFIALLLIPTYNNFLDLQERDTYARLIQLTRIGQNMIDVQRLLNITSPRDYMSADYKALRNATIEAQVNIYGHGSNNLPSNNGLYSAMYKLENGKLYAIMDFDSNANIYKPVEIQNEYNDAIQNHSIVSGIDVGENGTRMFAMGPLYDSQGNIIGLYKTIMDRNANKEISGIISRSIAVGIVFTILAVVLLIIISTRVFLKSVQQVQAGNEEITRGNYAVKIDINTSDEIGELANSFNMMADEVKKRVEETTALNSSYSRFVPREFIKLVGRKSILETKLGDHMSREMSILFADIRFFTAISEVAPAEETIKIIN
ncbi:MAG: HAMP domain-containing protein, partial [Candidatus Saccharibacteria bacterium]